MGLGIWPDAKIRGPLRSPWGQMRYSELQGQITIQVVLHISGESVVVRVVVRVCCSPGYLQHVVGDLTILVPEIVFTLKQKISYKDLLSGKTPHTLFPAGFFLSEILL
jgi:hypothetical protein